MTKTSKRPRFSTDSARAAQRLAVKSRRATNDRLRNRLVDLLPHQIPIALRRRLVAALGQRLVDEAVLTDPA